MTLKAYIWAMRLLVLVSFAALLAVLTYVDPEASGMPGKLIFYVVLGFFLSGFLGLFMLFIRRKTLGEEAAQSNAGLSLRQGILLAILVIALLVLQSFRMLVWWDGLLVLAGVILIELYFLSRG
jgi:hypothetical protein